jgi:predicted aspartyl protease
MKTPYSQKYFPPAPVLMVSVAVPAGSPFKAQPALIDTGADGTFVPTSLLEQLDVPMVYSTNVRSHLGLSSQRVTVHKIDLVFGAIRLPNIDVISDDWGDEIIIGRNVLNKLRLWLDGPRQIMELKD